MLSTAPALGAPLLLMRRGEFFWPTPDHSAARWVNGREVSLASSRRASWILGINLEGRLKFPHRFLLLVLRFQDQAQLIMRLGGARIRGERGAKMFGGLGGSGPGARRRAPIQNAPRSLGARK